jgi:hypothetical protein
MECELTRADKIRQLKAARPDLKNAEIARMVGCSYPHVTQTLQTIPMAIRTAHHSLAPDEMTFLECEAKKHELTTTQMAVAFLRDAIYEAQNS